jgi:hypothetical protein
MVLIIKEYFIHACPNKAVIKAISNDDSASYELHLGLHLAHEVDFALPCSRMFLYATTL